jgi:hypothetical protein
MKILFAMRTYDTQKDDSFRGRGPVLVAVAGFLRADGQLRSSAWHRNQEEPVFFSGFLKNTAGWMAK